MIPFWKVLCRQGELLPIRRLAEFHTLLEEYCREPDPAGKRKLHEKLRALLPAGRREKSGTAPLAMVLREVWEAFFGERSAAPLCVPFDEGVLRLSEKYGWTPDYVLSLPYPVFAALLAPGKREPAPEQRFSRTALCLSLRRLLMRQNDLYGFRNEN